MATPQVPPRPIRSQHQQTSGNTSVEPPKIPPRPQHHAALDANDHRESYARSPLNEPPLAMSHGNLSGNLYSVNGNSGSSSSLGLPQRPPSVSLPSIGQEGNEYADLDYNDREGAVAAELGSPEQMRNVGSDLPLHAPKPSLSKSDAKARIATVTRTDSSQAAAMGIGKAPTPVHGDDRDPHARALKPKSSFARTGSSASTERPSSQQTEYEQDHEHGIPEIGQRVPMYPDAGDVQAPSPSPFSQTAPSGIGFHNDGMQRARHHGRTRSGREVFSGPPGSYGLHGHGVPPQNVDKFEKAWYDKHPDALLREEQGQYSPGINGRGEFVLSSEDLNKIVRDTASRGSGYGTSPDIVGRPDDQIGYIASEEYVARLSSSRAAHSPYIHKIGSNSQTHVESPLRKTSFPVDQHSKEDFTKSKGSDSGNNEHALESEAEDEDIIHIDPPDVRINKITGGGIETEDLGPHGGNTDAEGGWIDEAGYGVPILASDEVAKEPGFEHLQPAVSPSEQRRGSGAELPPYYHTGHRVSRSSSATNSRPSSRPGSIHGGVHGFAGLTKYMSHEDREDTHTPLEDVDEYEPLFPEDAQKTDKNLHANLFKNRPDIKRRFPSQDIWEDTPNSLQLQAEVNTPEPVEESPAPATQTKANNAFETPEAEATRKGVVTEKEKSQLIPKEEQWAKSHFKPHLIESIRPGIKQRFPSRDIWEDSPDSAQLVTTVEDSPKEEQILPQDAGTEAGAVVQTTGRPNEGKVIGDQPREGATAGASAVPKPSIPPRPTRTKHTIPLQDAADQSPPSIPPRPQRVHQVPPAEIPPLTKPLSKPEEKHTPTELRKVPNIPERPKPQVPARPGKTTARDVDRLPSLSKATSNSSAGSEGDAASDSRGMFSTPPAPKPKPALPSRPMGGKIAALKAGFLSDLDKRLATGPQAPTKPQEKEEVKEEEKAPLQDARKGRARGPARRKPAASSPPEEVATAPKTSDHNLTVAEPWTLWQIHEDGDGQLDAVHAVQNVASSKKEESTIAAVDAPTEAPELKAPEEALPEKMTSDIPMNNSTEPLLPKEPEPESAEALPAEKVAEATTEPSISESSTQAAITSETTEPPLEPLEKTTTAKASVQTGERNITLNPGSPEEIKLTAYDGALAQEEGSVVIKDGEREEAVMEGMPGGFPEGGEE